MGRKHGRHGAVKKKTEKQQQQPRHFVVPAKHVYATRADRAFGFIVVLLGEFQPILPHAGGGYKPKRSEKKAGETKQLQQSRCRSPNTFLSMSRNVIYLPGCVEKWFPTGTAIA